MDQHAPDALELLGLDGVKGVHGKCQLVGGVLLGHEDQRRDDDGDDTDGGRKAVVAADLAHEFIVNEHREGPVALADQHGRAEIRQGAHKYQQAAGQNGGHDQRDNQAEETLHAAAAQVKAGFH